MPRTIVIERKFSFSDKNRGNLLTIEAIASHAPSPYVEGKRCLRVTFSGSGFNSQLSQTAQNFLEDVVDHQSFQRLHRLRLPGAPGEASKPLLIISYAAPCMICSAPLIRYWAEQKQAALLVPAVGYLGHTWYDGPIVGLDHHGQVTHYIPQGFPCATEVDLAGTAATHLQSVLDQQAPALELLRQSLVWAFRESRPHLQSQELISLELDLQTPQAACAVVLMRQAWSAVRVKIDPGQKTSPLAPAWRRLIQNLGFELPLTGSKYTAGQVRHLKTSDLAALLPETTSVEDFVAELNRYSPVIPTSLLATY